MKYYGILIMDGVIHINALSEYFKFERINLLCGALLHQQNVVQPVPIGEANVPPEEIPEWKRQKSEREDNATSV